MRTNGFCSELLRCGEIKLIAEKREYAISDLIANITRTKRRRKKSFGIRNGSGYVPEKDYPTVSYRFFSTV